MEEVQTDHPGLLAVAAGIPLLADLNRGDVVLYEKITPKRFRVVAQAPPHSVPPIHTRSIVGHQLPLSELPAVTGVLHGRAAAQGPRQMSAHRAHIIQRAYAVNDEFGRLVGVLTIEKSLVEYERHATRRGPFRRLLHDLRDAVLRRETEGFKDLTPFKESDGIVLVNEKGIITYVSGLGSYHYRRIGYYEELIGKPIAQLDTADGDLVKRAFDERRPFEDEREEHERLWIRKLIPLVGPRYRVPDRFTLLRPHGFGPRNRSLVLITLHDATVARRKAQEQVVRQAMVQEIHHRVKNNLQTVASLLRIQARRAKYEETKVALKESINRILSIAVVHEFLSQHEKTINLRDVAKRIAAQVRDGILDPSLKIRIRVSGDPVFLHAHQTTMIALVINELILNALEHGFGHLTVGEIVISFTDEGDKVRLVVRDTGGGLPPDFNLSEVNSLGLRIVQTIVGQDLRGTFKLINVENGTAAMITFAKSAPETFG
ncbi:MAG: sensor histidine kinase [Ardenticatenaceae bacterium]